jgi:hypothetical protein
MKLRLSILLLAAVLAASPAAGQTIKSLGYNTTNGNIVAATNVTFTNSVGFATNARAATRTNLGGTTVGNSVFTATNAAAAATAVGLGTTNDVQFNKTLSQSSVIGGGTDAFLHIVTPQQGEIQIGWGSGDFEMDELALTLEQADWKFYKPFSVPNATNRAIIRTNLELGAANNVTFSNITASGTLGVSDAATFSTNVTVNGNLSVGSFTTTTPSTWALDATQIAAATNGILALPSNANVIRLTNNNAISGVSGGVLGAFYYLVNQTTNAVTISNVGGITVQGGTPLTLGANEAATLVATGATNASVAARGDLTDVALGGTANTAPSQTADSGSSLMTRDLSDARYPIYETIYPNNNQTAADTGNFYGPAITIPLNWVPSSIQIYAELEFTSSPVAAGPTNFRFRTSIRDVEGASMNTSLNTSVVNATSVTNVSGDRYIIKGEITTFPASWSTRLASHETIFLVLDATVFNETGGSLTLVNNQSHRVGYRIFR